jgi:hypothetical protein
MAEQPSITSILAALGMMAYSTLQSLMLMFIQLPNVPHLLLHSSNNLCTRSNQLISNHSKVISHRATKAPPTRYHNLSILAASI